MPDTDSLAVEHEKVAAWVKAALASLPAHSYYKDVDLKSLPEGKALLDGDAEQSRRYVLAALEQTREWDRAASQLRNSGKTEIERNNPHMNKAWPVVWGQRRQAAAVVNALMRRTLPFTEEDLIALIDWCDAQANLSSYQNPVGPITRAITRYAGQSEISPPLLAALKRYVAKLKQMHEKEGKQHATTIEQLYAKTDTADDAPATPGRPLVRGAAGHANIHRQLKRTLGLITATEEIPATAVEPDQYRLPADSPLRAEHEQLSELFPQYIGRHSYNEAALDQTPGGQAVLAASDQAKGRLLLAATERFVAGQLGATDLNAHTVWQSRAVAGGVMRQLAAMDVTLGRDDLFDLLLVAAALGDYAARPLLNRLPTHLDRVEKFAREKPLSEGERYTLHLVRLAMFNGPPLGAPDDTVRRLTAIIADHANFWLVPGEAWTDAANADISALPGAQRQAWATLLRHALTATAARPSAKWLKAAEPLVKAAGDDAVGQVLLQWFPKVNHPDTPRRIAGYWGDRSVNVMNDQNANALRGLLWLTPLLKGDFAHGVAAVALSAYRKVPGVGPRATKVGNAAVYTLSAIGNEAAVGQLALLKVRVKFGTAQKEIEKAFDAAAQKLGLPRERIEEMGVPTYGLTDVGQGVETFGEYTATLSVDGSDAELVWADAKGKTLKSVPAKVKADHKDDLKELQQSVKDIAAMLPAQRDRIDALFLSQKTWPAKDWRECYLDHPLVGTIARRLIWTVGQDGDRDENVIWHNGRLVNVDDEPVEVAPDATVTLWHPIGRPLDDVLAWRAWLTRHEVRQPFKQAHREVYPLTDAERRTETYSNRFAAHVLRQHQFNALCAARGWKNKLRMMVDDSYPPATRELPQWGLRAEFWIEGVGDHYGVDTNDSGAYLRITTDQVRFYRTAAARTYAHAGGGGYTASAAGPGADNVNAPLPLEQVPPLVLSEIMRDVDLFVGVASVGNDPTWQDGGPAGRFRTYWHDYSFGDLSETAKTRRDVLANLLPRLTKLRDKWSLDDKFLVIRGKLRTYKIHLGSGNILMEPNDQYLCIVADRSSGKSDDVFLPFEGDSTLSIILSKAFLLAADDKIKDPTITRQIGQG